MSQAPSLELRVPAVTSGLRVSGSHPEAGGSLDLMLWPWTQDQPQLHEPALAPHLEAQPRAQGIIAEHWEEEKAESLGPGTLRAAPMEAIAPILLISRGFVVSHVNTSVRNAEGFNLIHQKYDKNNHHPNIPQRNIVKYGFTGFFCLVVPQPPCLGM